MAGRYFNKRKKSRGIEAKSLYEMHPGQKLQIFYYEVDIENRLPQEMDKALQKSFSNR